MKDWWLNRKKALRRIEVTLINERRELAKHGYTVVQVDDAAEMVRVAIEIIHTRRLGDVLPKCKRKVAGGNQETAGREEAGYHPEAA